MLLEEVSIAIVVLFIALLAKNKEKLFAIAKREMKVRSKETIKKEAKNININTITLQELLQLLEEQ